MGLRGLIYELRRLIQILRGPIGKFDGALREMKSCRIHMGLEGLMRGLGRVNERACSRSESADLRLESVILGLREVKEGLKRLETGEV